MTYSIEYSFYRITKDWEDFHKYRVDAWGHKIHVQFYMSCEYYEAEDFKITWRDDGVEDWQVEKFIRQIKRTNLWHKFNGYED